MMKKKVLYPSLILIAAAGAAAWYYWEPLSSYALALETSVAEELGLQEHADNDADDEHADSPFITLTQQQIDDSGIQMEEASPGELNLVLSTRGKIVLHPDRVAHILPKVSGIVKEARKNIGDDVEAGEVLAIIESREIADAKAEYLAAKEREKLAKSLMERESQLNQKKISPEQEYIQAKSHYTEAKINLQLATQKLFAFGFNEADIASLTHQKNPELRYYEIRAPFHGTIINRHMTQGEFVEGNSMIYELADLSTLWVEIGIYPKHLVKIKEGQQVEVILPYDQSKASAQLSHLSPIIQDETISAKAIAELDNANRNWRPGSFVKVNVFVENTQVPCLVCKEAVQQIEDGQFVFIRTEEGFEKRAVQVGRSDSKSVEILTGIAPGEHYASSQAFLLKAEHGKGSVEGD